MKQLYLLLSLLCSSFFFTYGQTVNNWIDYNKTYYKIKVGKDGLYRITQPTLQAAGLNAIGNDLKLWNKGKEVPLYVTQNGEFTASDYIEFYGKKNDGEFDTQLYKQANHQPHVQHSLFSDTATYFLEITENQANSRYTTAENIIENPPPKEEFFINKSLRVYNNSFLSGKPVRISATNVSSPDFTEGEGLGSITISENQNNTFGLATRSVYRENGGEAIIETKLVGRSDDIGFIDDHTVTIGLGGEIYNTIKYEGYTSKKSTFTVPLTAITEPSTSLTYTSVLEEGVIANKNAVVYIQITYPHSFDFSNTKSHHFSLNNNGNKYLEITNFNGGSDPILYDLTNNLRFVPVEENGVYKFLIKPVGGTNANRDFVFINPDFFTLQQVNELTPKQFTNFGVIANQGDYIILSHPSLMTGEVNEVERYKDYRASEAGGSYSPVVVDVEELFDQFAWGIRKHPMAIRNFINMAKDIWFTSPTHLLILAKGVNYQARTPNQYANNLVPTFGHNSSDIMLTSPTIDSYRNQVAVGRVPATTSQEVGIYLDKIINYEDLQQNNLCSPEDRLWLKNALHIAGGNNLVEANAFMGALGRYETTYENVLFGGNVSYTYNKLTEDAIETVNLDDFMNQGLGIINFVGHSSGQYWAVDLKPPTEYTNYGKYSMVFTSSCLVGDINADRETSTGIIVSMPEEYIFAENLGAIGFLATSAVGFPSYLDVFTREVYQNFCKENYGKSLGTCIQVTTNTIADINSNMDGHRFTAQTFSLAGDPALTLGASKNPEFFLEHSETGESDVFFTPSQITTNIDSFALNVIVTNMGKTVEDSFVIHIERTLEDGTAEVVVEERIPSINYVDTLTFFIQTGNPNLVVGENNFTIQLDYLQEIAEDCEDNNRIEVSKFIFSDLLIPIYPCDFAIVNEPTVTLAAATGSPLLPTLGYQFELSTDQSFTTVLEQTNITSESGIIQWQPTTNLTNNTVYYWRAGNIPEAGTPVKWKTSSFTYIDTSSTGWNQAHYQQYGQNDLTYMEVDTLSQQVNYVFADYQLVVTNNYNAFTNIEIQLNANQLGANTCMSVEDGCFGGVGFMVFKQGQGLIPLQSMRVNNETGCGGRGTYGNLHCAFAIRNNIEFLTNDPEQFQAMIAFMQNTIKEGYYVLAYSLQNHRLNVDNATEDLTPIHDFFDSLGLPDIRTIQNNEAFIAFGRKGYPNEEAKVFVESPPLSTGFSIDQSFKSQVANGKMNSVPIGPSLAWKDLTWDWEAAEENSADVIHLNMYGLGNNGWELLMNNITNPNTDISHISATDYPFLRLEAVSSDTVKLTAPQVNYWRVNFTRMPEIGLDKQAHFEFNNDTLQEGEKLKLSFAVTNVEVENIDSIPVSYTIVDQNNNRTIINKKYAPITSGKTNIIDFEYETKGLLGKNELSVNVNPTEATDHQPEKFDFNNTMLLSFLVEKDKINPLVDITFDGRHITNGDIVSAKPTILIQLKDENQYLALNDTSDFSIGIRQPDFVGIPSTEQIIPFSSDQLIFRPAVLTANGNNKNVAEVEFLPTFSEDGIYELVITAKDKSGNTFGKTAYTTTFEVITTPALSNVVNYPNPFTSSTRFLFTLTGAEVPETFTIQIMTISGRVVREITQAELGNIQIGNNLTEFAWDGTDEFGSPLANGLYLYKIKAKLNGQPLEKSANGADAYFKNGIGKMYLMR